jgi:hypothetical protein
MICKECGARFDETEAQCPFCGALNYIGAESKYMEHLMDMKEDLSEMSDDSSEAYHATFKKSTLIIITTICVLAILAALIISIILGYSSYTSKSDAKLVKAQMQWRQEYYDDLDQMYNAKDYDGILNFYDEHSTDEGFSPYNWAHSDFIMLYDTYTQFQTLAAYADTTDLNELTWCLYSAASLDYDAVQDFYSYTDEEMQLIASWQEETAAFYHDTLGLSDEEIAEMKSAICDDNTLGFPSSKACKKYLKQRFE